MIQVAVRNGQVIPALHRVDFERGDQFRLIVDSDEADEVHVHGFDVEKPVRPGEPAVFNLTADQPGLYEVETHESELTLLQLVVR